MSSIAPAAACRKTWPSAPACRLFARPLARRMSWTPCSPNGAVFGGEGNGGPIDPRVGLVRDSFVGMALLLDAMAERRAADRRDGRRLAALRDREDEDFAAEGKDPAGLAALEAHFNDAAVNRMDGLRLDWPDRWLLVRGSNTEPIVRAIAEAPTADEAKRLCDEAAGERALRARYSLTATDARWLSRASSKPSWRSSGQSASTVRCASALLNSRRAISASEFVHPAKQAAQIIVRPAKLRSRKPS